MVKDIKNVVTWLKNWFYDKNEVYTKSETYTKNEVDTALGNKLNSNLTTANKMLVTDNNGNVVLDDKPTFEAIKIVASLPTASADTMGALYIISENSKVNVYYTKSENGSYTWQKMDADILDELSISWDDVTDKPSTFTPSSHTHGQITNDGKVATVVTVAGEDSIVITDFSDSGKIKRVNNLLASHIEDSNAHTNIGSLAYARQSTINTKIDSAISNLKSSRVTSMELIPKGSDPTADAYDGVIRLYYGDEPQNE